MKYSKLSFWLLIGVGTIGVVASVLLIFKGSDFSNYFLSGFCGLVLIGKALIKPKKRIDEV